MLYDAPMFSHPTKLALLFTMAFAAAAVAQETGVVIQALVDGPSELRVTRQGLYWVNGANAKPGRHEGRNEPTYVNGVAWTPVWQHNEEERGIDKSEVYVLPAETLRLNVDLLSVGEKQDAEDIEVRTPIKVSSDSDEVAIIIPDPEPGPRWYKFRITPRLPK